jgi:hypothetical protein
VIGNDYGEKEGWQKGTFVPEKIVVIMIKTGAPADYARTIAQDSEQSARDGITKQEIKTKALGMLKEKNPEWERNWIVYDVAVKKRTG